MSAASRRPSCAAALAEWRNEEAGTLHTHHPGAFLGMLGMMKSLSSETAASPAIYDHTQHSSA